MKFSKPLLIILGVVFLLVDQLLKWQVLHAWREPVLFGRFFGWELFLNPGVAFSLPVPNSLVLLITVPVILIMLWSLGRQIFAVGCKLCDVQLRTIGLWYIILGASSNFVDRLLYGVTVDYVRIFTGVINVADVLIVAGFVVYFRSLRRKV